MSVGASTVVVLLIAAMTYLMRASVILLVAGRTIPPVVSRALRQVGPAVLAALAINLIADGDGGSSVTAAEVGALVAAGATAWWRRSVIWSLVAGMAVLLTLGVVV